MQCRNARAKTVILRLHCSGDFRKMDGCVPSNCFPSFPLGQVRAIYLIEKPLSHSPFLALNPVCSGGVIVVFMIFHGLYLRYYSNGTERLLYPGPGAELPTLSSRILQKPLIGIIIRCLFQMRKLTRREGRIFCRKATKLEGVQREQGSMKCSLCFAPQQTPGHF